MKIGIDCRTMLNPGSGERAGVGHYTYHLVKALLQIDRQNIYVLYFDHHMPSAITDDLAAPNVTIRRLLFSRYRKFLPFAYSHLLFAAFLMRDRLDVFHAPANVMPLSYSRPTVVTIHDLAIYEHPEWFPTQFASTRLLVPQTVKKASAIIAVSKATKRDLLNVFDIPSKRISVVPEAADTVLLKLRDRTADVRKIYKLPKKYILYVGTIEPRKNLTALIQAWQRLVDLKPATVKNTVLVIAGGVGFRGQDVIELLATLKVRSIRTLGYIPHNHKVKLMATAAAFVFPTWYEGFGLPILEAMQLGTPVISSSVPAMAELTGDVALLSKPDDIEALANNIRKVLTNPRLAQKMSQAGKTRAKEFSWKRTAQATLAVYCKVI